MRRPERPVTADIVLFEDELAVPFADDYILLMQATPILAIVLLLGAGGVFIADNRKRHLRRRA